MMQRFSKGMKYCPSSALAISRHRSTRMLRLALHLFYEMPWSARLVVGVVSLGWACVSCVCASVMWAQDTQPHDFDQSPVYEQALDADRPHFPEASSTVARGRLLLEGGFTLATTHVP